jgi:hypothetical protein
VRVQVRFATYNTSLNRNKAGGLLAELQSGVSAQAANVSAILQTLRAEILVLNEFDYEPYDAAVQAFQDSFLSVPQAPELDPLRQAKPHWSVNTNVGEGGILCSHTAANCSASAAELQCLCTALSMLVSLAPAAQPAVQPNMPQLPTDVHGHQQSQEACTSSSACRPLRIGMCGNQPACCSCQTCLNTVLVAAKGTRCLGSFSVGPRHNLARPFVCLQVPVCVYSPSQHGCPQRQGL